MNSHTMEPERIGCVHRKLIAECVVKKPHLVLQGAVRWLSVKEQSRCIRAGRNKALKPAPQFGRRLVKVQVVHSINLDNCGEYSMPNNLDVYRLRNHSGTVTRFTAIVAESANTRATTRRRSGGCRSPGPGDGAILEHAVRPRL